MIRFTCPRCRNALSAPKGFEGRTSTCRNCKQAVMVPGGAVVVAAMPKPQSRPGNAPQQAAAPNPAKRAIAGLVDNQPRAGAGRAYLDAAKWFALSLAILLALMSAVLPLVGFDGLPSYAVAGFAVVAGFGAVGLVIVGRRSMMEGAIIAVFLSVAGLLFTINLAVTASKSEAAADVMAKATAKENEFRQEGEKSASGQKSTADMSPEAKDSAAKAEAALIKAAEAEARAAEQARTAIQLLEQVKAEQILLDNKRDQLAKQTADLAAERAKIDAAKANLEDQKRDLEASKKAAAELAQKLEDQKRDLEASKKAAAELAQKLEDQKRDLEASKKAAAELAQKAPAKMQPGQISPIVKAPSVEKLPLTDQTPSLIVKEENAMDLSFSSGTKHGLITIKCTVKKVTNLAGKGPSSRTTWVMMPKVGNAPAAPVRFELEKGEGEKMDAFPAGQEIEIRGYYDGPISQFGDVILHNCTVTKASDKK
jgi:hypothetical protein